MIAIIFAHPWEGSFNKAILDAITVKLDHENREYRVIDLHKDNFDPVMSTADLALYSKGKSADPRVEEYQNILKSADEVIFLFPIWWGTMPAILKGFFDKVLLVNFSHNYENGWTPLLKIKKTWVITTSESPTDKFRKPIEVEFIQNNLEPVGISNGQWINCDHASKGSQEHRDHFISDVVEII